MMCVTTTDMRSEGFCEVRDCSKNINNNNNNRKSSGNNNNKCIRDVVDVHSDVRNAEYNSKNISNSCKIGGGCDGNNNNVICDRPRCNRYVYRLVFPFFYFNFIITSVINSNITQSEIRVKIHLNCMFCLLEMITE